MKTLALLALVTLAPFAAHADDSISKVRDLPSDTLNCTLLFKDRGVMAQLLLSDGGQIRGQNYLRGTLSLTRNRAIVKTVDDLEVIISGDLKRIDAGMLGLNGEEVIPVSYLRMKQNDMLSSGDIIGYSGAVAVNQPFSGSIPPASNAACVFAK